jgi:uncharacterized damage-inducible protein DinB
VNYYGAKELASSFRTVRKNTIQIAQDIPEEKYSFRPAPETRTVSELFAHIALTYRFQYRIHVEEHRTSMDGFDFHAMLREVQAEEKTPRNKEQMIELLRTTGEKWAGWLDGLSDDFLGEQISGRGGSRSRFEMILSLKEHEMHHRGQLMLIERLIGIVPHLTRETQARMAAR